MKIIFICLFLYYILTSISSYLNWITPEKKRPKNIKNEDTIKLMDPLRLSRTSEIKGIHENGAVFGEAKFNERITIEDDDGTEMTDINNEVESHRLSLSNLLLNN